MPYIGRGLGPTGAFRILDDISGSFNGTLLTFALSSGNAALTVGLPQTLVIAVDGVVQEPGTAYTISGSNIVFGSAPQAEATFWGVELGDVGGLADRATTQSAGDNSTKVATTAYVDAQVATEDTIAEMGDVTISSIASGEVLKWSGSAWINNTLAELGVAALSGAVFTGTVTTPSVLFKGSSNAITMDVNNGVAAYSIILPDSAPATDRYLKTTSGSTSQLEWGTVTPAAITGTSGGADTYIAVYNTASTLDGSSALTYDGTVLTNTGSGAREIVNHLTATSGADSRMVVSIPASASNVAYIGFHEGSGDGSANNMGYRMGYDANANYFRIQSRDLNGSGGAGNVLEIPDGGTDIKIKENTSMPSVTKGIAKAWCKVAGSDGALETGSYGISSTSRNSTGVYKIFWNPDFSGTNYVVMTSQLNVNTDHIAVQDSRATTYALLEHTNSSGTASDKNMMCVAFGEVV